MEEFQKLLKDKAQPFDLHEAVRDNSGNEAYVKVDRDAVATKTNIQAIAVEVAN